MTMTTKILQRIIVFFMIFSILTAQQIDFQSLSGNVNTTQSSGERYITDENGVIKMYVNIWGHVRSPGIYLVYEGIDILTLLSIAGGPLEGAKLSELILYRTESDTEKIKTISLDLEKYLAESDTTQMITIQPNDTFYIQQTFLSTVMANIALLNTALMILNLYVQIQRLN